MKILKCRRVLCKALLPVMNMAFLCSLSLTGCAAPQNGTVGSTPTPKKVLGVGKVDLITGIDTELFCRAIGVDVPVQVVAVGSSGVSYTVKGDNTEKIKGFSLGVYPSAQAAKRVFERPGRSHPFSKTPSGIGDQLICQVDDGSEMGIPNYVPRVSLLLRRKNVIFETGWQGTLHHADALAKEAVAFANKVDSILNSNQEICPHGFKVPIPTVHLELPPKVSIHTEVKVSFESEGGELVLPERAESLGWATSGTALYAANSVGRQTPAIEFATQKNVLFNLPITVDVLTAAQFSKISTQQRWEWAGHRIFFVHSNATEVQSISPDDREGIDFMPSTFEPLMNAENLKKQALNDLTHIVRSPWLPSTINIQIFRDHSQTMPREAYCTTFKIRGRNVAYWGIIGEHVWLYIESPATSGNTIQTNISDVLLKDKSPFTFSSDVNNDNSLPSFESASRTFQRLRSLHPTGPWQPVSILLAQVTLPSQLNLMSPGYP